MNIVPVQNTQTPNFQGLHADKKVLKGLNCTEDFLLKNPQIRECAKKYEILIKRKKVDGHRELDFIITWLGGLMSMGLGAFVGFLGTMFMCVKNKDMSPAVNIPMLVGMFGGPILYTIGTIIYRNKPAYQYVVQGGKGITQNAFGETRLTGAKSKEYKIDDYHLLDSNQNLVQEIQDEDYGKFRNTIRKYNINELDNPQNILSILRDPVIKKDFSSGDCFNYTIHDESLLTKFFDIIPTDENQKDYDEILYIMKGMKNIDYNQVDRNGISVLEKILNSENPKTLELVRNFEFHYLRDIDYAYENIQDEGFKVKAKNLNIKFTHVFDALKRQSPSALDAAVEEMKSPFCKQEKLVKEMIDFAERNCRDDFIVNVLYEKLRSANWLPKNAYDKIIAEHEERYNRWR